jgi:carbohydrate-selective porin OprB
MVERHMAGVAATHAGLHGVANRHETAIELYYRYTLNNHISLQPDFQYIINPSGADTRLSDALLGLLRLSVEF